jgi:hypothetical protein
MHRFKTIMNDDLLAVKVGMSERRCKKNDRFRQKPTGTSSMLKKPCKSARPQAKKAAFEEQ